jgi:hypothetical protein
MGMLGEAIIDVVPKDGSGIKLRVSFMDDDGVVNDSIGDETVDVMFDTGWRKDVPVYLTGSTARVIVTLNLEPV